MRIASSLRGNHPTLSVCIPLYNGERYLRESVDSVLAQTFRDFEIIFVDDGSTDRGVAVAEEYASKDSRIRVYKNASNLGLSGNCNRCLELARGEWIKFVFQDDRISPDCIDKMLAREAPFVSCQRALVFDEGTTDATKRWYEAHRSLVGTIFAELGDLATPDQCARLALEYFGTNIFGEPTSVLMHRRVFERVGPFNSTLINLCDVEMWNRITIHFGAALIAEDLATFRAHGASATATNAAKREYRATVLDPAIVLHQFARELAYEPLRRYATSVSPPIDVDAAFDWASHDALWTANQSGNGPRLDELRAVTDRYPGVRRGSAAHFMWRLRRRFFGLSEPPLLADRKGVGTSASS